MRRDVLALFLVAPISVGCHTITEELPSRPTPVQIGGIPVIKVPVPSTPTIAPTPAATPTPTPGPTPTPKPSATPTPAPTATPTPEPGDHNNNPVARMACSVYFVECNGDVMPGSHNATSASVGCRVHLDATTKDAGGDHTYRTEPHWVYSNPGMIDVTSRNPWNPAITGKGRHHQEMYAEADGVRCGSFGIDFN
jgi:hypothetical protein